jgi:ATP-dependent RNA helicase DeaD
MPDAALTEPGPQQMNNVDGWLKVGLSAALAEAASRAGLKDPTPLQRALIPVALQGQDCLVQARSGSGKTAAYALPVLQRVTPGIPGQALVLVATRELARQVYSRFRMLTAGQSLRTVIVLQTDEPNAQAAQLRRGPEIVIGTPKAVWDLFKRRMLKLSGVRMVVLDEVDQALKLGLRDDIRKVLGGIVGAHQTILVSAVLDAGVRELARSFARNPIEITVPPSVDSSHRAQSPGLARPVLPGATARGEPRSTFADDRQAGPIRQGYVSVTEDGKFAALQAFLKHVKPAVTVVFTNSTPSARRLAEQLRQAGLSCRETLSSQDRSDQKTRSARPGSAQVFVATDPHAPELRTLAVSHIVNYELPEDPTVYLSRINLPGQRRGGDGAARPGRAGYVVNFVTPEEGRLLTEIEKALNRELPKFDEPWVPEPPPPAPAAQEPVSSGPVVPKRYTEALRRDEALEARGIKPLPRTLGSRFRPPRRRR